MSESDNVYPFHAKHPVFMKRQNAVIGIQKYTRPPKEKIRKKVERKLTEENRKELDYLLNQWSEISRKAKSKKDHISYAYARTLLFQYGLDGKVNGMDQIEDLEFNQAKAYLLERIKIAEKKVPKTKLFNDSEFRKKTIAAIHARCRNLAVSDETRKAYQLARFGKESLTDFTNDELQEMYNYAMQGTPKFTIPRAKARTIQQDRENALRVLIGVMEANGKAKEQIFNPQRLPCSKLDMLALLKQRDTNLFGDMSEDQFNKFWSKQQVCKLKPGRLLGTGAQ